MIYSKYLPSAASLFLKITYMMTLKKIKELLLKSNFWYKNFYCVKFSDYKVVKIITYC
jgi:hypothetical protein